MRQLARLYEALLGRGVLDGHRVLSPQTVEAITARHRVGLYDETYQVPCDWGLGFAIDAYMMGRHASPCAFGHGGALSAVSFADPEHGLVAVVQTNGMCSNDDHYLRLDAVTSVVYEDLDLVPRGAPGREQALPDRRSVPRDPRGVTSTMADNWTTTKVDDVKAGDVVRYAGHEFTVARVDSPFLGRGRWCASSRTRRPGGTRTRRCWAATSRSWARRRDRRAAVPGAGPRPGAPAARRVLHRHARRPRRRRPAGRAAGDR